MARFTINESEQLIHIISKEHREAALKGLLSAAIRTVNYITTEVIPNEVRQPVDRGAYRAAWVARKLPNGAEIRNTLPYASIIEDGARPENIKIGKAMIAALTEWVQRKGIATGDDAAPMAWAIAQAMKKRGIFNGGKGLKILEKAVKKVPTFIREEIQRELRRRA